MGTDEPAIVSPVVEGVRPKRVPRPEESVAARPPCPPAARCMAEALRVATAAAVAFPEGAGDARLVTSLVLLGDALYG